ncbi:DUF7289 family protein [Natronorubrum sp. DTA7]|uniref:DUF7289 family protein n=1 Tax=Natronorubrum sp. DTA7 TaxID=3447016 RepID=UPI003F84BD9D
MIAPRGENVSISAGRGQSTVLGIVLLIGMVAAGSVGILLVAGDSISDIEHESEQDRIEQAFVELSQKMGESSTNDDVTQSMDLEAGEQGAVARQNTGWINVSSDGLNEPINETIGTIEYESDDGTKIAYEAGGVFRETGEETRVVSAPPINYDVGSETLSLPVVTVSGEQTLHSGDIKFKHQNTTTYADANVVEDADVTVTIKSEYYRGWQRFFEQEAGDTVTDNVDPDNQTVTVKLGYQEMENAFDTGVTHPPDGLDDFCTGSPHDPDCVIGDNAQEGLMQPIDPVVNDMIADAKSGEMEVENLSGEEAHDGEDQLSAGTYFTESIEESGHFEFDLSDGNATLIVEDDILADGKTITVDDWDDDHHLRVYAGGDLIMDGGGDICVQSCTRESAKLIQVYGTSEMGVDFGTGGSPQFEGVLYAASDKDSWGERAGQCDTDVQVCIQSNPEIFGSIVAGSVDVHSNAMDFTYDTDLQDADIDMYPDEYSLPPRLTYLNVAHHEVDIKNN